MRTFALGAARGMAATEFLLVSIPLLLTGLGAFELARWHLARQMVSHALLEGARAGAVSHGNPQAIQAALQRALLPLYGTAGAGSQPVQAGARQDAHHTALQARYGLTPWQVEVLSPRAAHFQDFPGPFRHGMRTINNSYQREQHQRALSAGYPGGMGPASGQTIYAANTLTLDMTYLHTPMVPGLRALLRQMGHAAAGNTFASRAMRQAGVLALRQRISIAMQSAPHDWAAGGVNNPIGAGPPIPITPVRQLKPGCIGLWCDTAWPGRDAATANGMPPALPQPGAPALPDDAQQACGVALCCADGAR